MNSVEVDSDNSYKDGNDQDNQIEEDNENERDTLQVVELDGHSPEKPNSNKYCKIVLVIFISIIFLGAIFFIASKEVKTLYENRAHNDSKNTDNNLNLQNNNQINKIENYEKGINNNFTMNNSDLNYEANEVNKIKEKNTNPLENNNNIVNSNKIESKMNPIDNSNSLSDNKTNEIFDINKLRPIEDEEQRRDIHFDFNETNKIIRNDISNQSEVNQNKIENNDINSSKKEDIDNNFLSQIKENITIMDINNNIKIRHSTDMITNENKDTKSLLQSPLSNTNRIIYNQSNENITFKTLEKENLINNLSLFLHQTDLKISSQNIVNNNMTENKETTNSNFNDKSNLKEGINNNKSYSSNIEEKINGHNYTNVMHNIYDKLIETNYNKEIKLSEINNLTYLNRQVYGSDKIIKEDMENNSAINFTENIKENLTDRNSNFNGTKKIGLAFVYSTLFSNGIARFITVTANHFMKTGKYDIIFITGKPYHKEYSYDKRIKRYIGDDNFTIIKNITQHENIDFFILQNFLGPNTIQFYKSLGKKVIGMFHGVYMSAMFHNEPLDYKNWLNFDLFDSFIFIAADDYYFYKKLGFKNEIYIPNLYTFDPKEIKESNLTNHNILMLGRLNDEIKGLIYAVKTLYYIVKEVPDAKLTLVTSDYRIDFAKNLSKELNISDHIVINYHTYNISKHFWNSAVHMYTSLTEAFPMAMNEAKAHGLPIVAFDVPFSPPYQDGVITVDLLDCKGLARETIKLLKDYNYRKKMGEASKLSLNKYSNEETIELWGKLFKSLLSEDRNDYREFQKEIESKYYNEKIAKKHIEKHYNALLRYNKNFTCYTLDNFLDADFIKNIKECTPIKKL